MPKALEVTEHEKRVLGLLLKNQWRNKPIQAVAEVLGVSDNAVKQLLWRLRRRYAVAHRFIGQYQLWRKRLGRKYL